MRGLGIRDEGFRVLGLGPGLGTLSFLSSGFLLTHLV